MSHEKTILPKGWREGLEIYYQHQRLLDDHLKPIRDALGDQLNKYWHADEDTSIALLSENADISCCLILSDYFKGDPVLVDAAYRKFGLYDQESWDEILPGHDKTWGQEVVEMTTSAYHLEREYFPESSIEYISSDGWGPLISLNDHSNLPIFPIDQIPGPCGEFARSLPKHIQVDPGLVGTMILAAISTALGGKVHTNLGTHKEPCNAYFMAILPSGNRKSEASDQCSEPIYTYQAEQQNMLRPCIEAQKNRNTILQRRLDALQKKAAKLNDSGERELLTKQCDDVIAEMQANPIPKEPVYLVDDVTPEALGVLMADNNERMGVLSAEGGLFKNISGLYNQGQSNIDLFLKSHAGDHWSSNRIGRESKMMMHPALALGLAVQPHVIEEISKNAEFRSLGLLARFLYAACRSRAGFRSRLTEPLPPHVKAAYNEYILSLMEIRERCELTLHPKALLYWNSFYEHVERELRPGGELENLVDWGSKLPGAAARISGLLHFAGDCPGNEINLDTVFSAIQICQYYIEHAKYIFGIMGKNSTIIIANKILDYIRRCQPTQLKGRDLFDHTNLGNMKEIQQGLDILLEKNFIRVSSTVDTEKQLGRPVAVSYEVNPRIFS